ncbi:hypothetical protein D3C71_1571010 [compost metagenome]
MCLSLRKANLDDVEIHLRGLDTVLQETKNSYLYEKVVYKENGVRLTMNDSHTIVFYKKQVNNKSVDASITS